MASATVLSDRFDRALLYATHVHGGQARKGTSIPYIAHLLAVAATFLEYGGSEDMAIAGLLHDAVEDQGGEPRLLDIRNRFGDRVADIVWSCSDSVVSTSGGQQKEKWRTRKTQPFRNSLSAVQLVEQGLGLLQIGRVEAFGEPAVDRSEKIVGLLPLAMLVAARSFYNLAAGDCATVCARSHALALARFDTVSCQRVK